MGRDDPQDTWALTCNGREGAEKEEQGVMRGERKSRARQAAFPRRSALDSPHSPYPAVAGELPGGGNCCLGGVGSCRPPRASGISSEQGSEQGSGVSTKGQGKAAERQRKGTGAGALHRPKMAGRGGQRRASAWDCGRGSVRANRRQRTHNAVGTVETQRKV